MNRPWPSSVPSSRRLTFCKRWEVRDRRPGRRGLKHDSRYIWCMTYAITTEGRDEEISATERAVESNKHHVLSICPVLSPPLSCLWIVTRLCSPVLCLILISLSTYTLSCRCNIATALPCFFLLNRFQTLFCRILFHSVFFFSHPCVNYVLWMILVLPACLFNSCCGTGLWFLDSPEEPTYWVSHFYFVSLLILHHLYQFLEPHCFVVVVFWGPNLPQKTPSTGWKVRLWPGKVKGGAVFCCKTEICGLNQNPSHLPLGFTPCCSFSFFHHSL